jgi:hypothetical protein
VLPGLNQFSLLGCPEFVLLTNLSASTPAGLDHQLEDLLVAIETVFGFSKRLVDPLKLNLIVRLLLDNELHRALAFFPGHKSFFVVHGSPPPTIFRFGFLSPRRLKRQSVCRCARWMPLSGPGTQRAWLESP